MYAYKCTVSYEGTKYNGWQRQKNTTNTIQEKIETTLGRYLNEDLEITGSGRTDAGVHAIGQVFHFHCHQILTTDDFLQEINQFLPKDIRILSIEECDLRFHARLHVSQKTYRYQIDTSTYGNPFLRNFAHHIPTGLDIDAMKKGAEALIGTHDFKSFCSNKNFKKSSIRTIYDINIQPDYTHQMVLLTYTGDSFLYNMVRILTGTLIEIGLGIRQREEIPAILEGKERKLAGHTAPAKGLFLEKVDYFS